MADKKIALRMLLGGLHYTASELIKENPTYAAKFKGINAVLQWKSEPDGPNTYTIIKETTIEFNDDGIHDKPDFVMINKDLDQALEIFKGRYPITEAIQKGDVEVIGDKEKLLKITFYLMDLIPTIGELSGVPSTLDDVQLKQKMQIKALFYYVGRGLEVVSRSNEEFQEEFEELDGIFQWNVLGVSTYLIAKKGIFDVVYDATHDAPDVIFTVEDFNIAKDILMGQLDGTSAYMAGDLNIQADLQMGMKFAEVSEILVEELTDLLS